MAGKPWREENKADGQWVCGQKAARPTSNVYSLQQDSTSWRLYNFLKPCSQRRSSVQTQEPRNVIIFNSCCRVMPRQSSASPSLDSHAARASYYMDTRQGWFFTFLTGAPSPLTFTSLAPFTLDECLTPPIKHILALLIQILLWLSPSHTPIALLLY